MNADISFISLRDCLRSPSGWGSRRLGSLFLAALFLIAAPDAGAQSRQVVEGVVVNVGWIRAEDAAKFEAERGIHRSHLHKKGVYHLVVTLSDTRTGKSISNAKVTAVFDDPLDRVQRRPLKKAETAGFTDYSDYYEFSTIGRYFLNLEITLEGRATPLKVRFQRDYDGSK